MRKSPVIETIRNYLCHLQDFHRKDTGICVGREIIQIYRVNKRDPVIILFPGQSGIPPQPLVAREIEVFVDGRMESWIGWDEKTNRSSCFC